MSLSLPLPAHAMNVWPPNIFSCSGRKLYVERWCVNLLSLGLISKTQRRPRISFPQRHEICLFDGVDMGRAGKNHLTANPTQVPVCFPTSEKKKLIKVAWDTAFRTSRRDSHWISEKLGGNFSKPVRQPK